MEGAADRIDAPLVLALHGQGMSAEALARLFEPLFSLPLRFVLPTAPLQSRGGRYDGPSWYDYDGDQSRFLAGLQRTEKLLLDFLGSIESQRQWKPSRRVLFGFSQGGYCGSYVALRHPDVFGGLVVSGARVKVEILAEPLQRAAQTGFEVLLCHGRRDRHVPFDSAQTSYEGLAAAGVRVTLRPFPAGHAMGAKQIEAIREWLVEHFRLG